MKHFQQIVIQSKDDKTDFRAFVSCVDEYGNIWELRAYGSTASEAAQNAWEKYLSESWEDFGYVVKKKKEL